MLAETDTRVAATYGPSDPRALPVSETVGGWAELLGAGASLQRQYDHFDNPIGTTLPGAGLTVTRTFDDLDRPLAAFISGSALEVDYLWGGVARSWGFETRAGAGVRQYFDHQPATGLLQSIAYHAGGDHDLGGFDLQWLASAGLKTGRGTIAPTQPQHLTHGLGWVWSHDGGHRLSTAVSGLHGGGNPTVPPELTGEWSFSYGSADELTTVTESAHGQDAYDSGPLGRITGRAGASGAEAFTYDSVGRRITDGRHAYLWDWRGRLVQVDLLAGEHAGERITYITDADGRLLTRTHWGVVPPGGGDDDRAFLAKRLFIWDGATLAAEIGLNHADEVLWRIYYLPGPSGLDDHVQAQVESGIGGDAPETRTSAYLRDELGSVIGVLEDRAVADGEPLPLLARYHYTPYGEAHLEAGPELLRVELDEGIREVNTVQQLPPEDGVRGPGTFVITTTLPFAEESLETGLQIEERDGDEWVEVPEGAYVVARDPQQATRLLVMRVAGFEPGLILRLRLTTTLEDHYGRAMVLPHGSLDEVEVQVAVPADLGPPSGLPRDFELLFDTRNTASSTLNDAFPGGQTSLFQGLWTDPTTGLSYARNRWYDARTASWLSEDPKGAVDSPNLYAFVGWGPHMGRDPMGDCKAFGILVGTTDPTPCGEVLAEGASRALELGTGAVNYLTHAVLSGYDEPKQIGRDAAVLLEATIKDPTVPIRVVDSAVRGAIGQSVELMLEDPEVLFAAAYDETEAFLKDPDRVGRAAFNLGLIALTSGAERGLALGRRGSRQLIRLADDVGDLSASQGQLVSAPGRGVFGGLQATTAEEAVFLRNARATFREGSVYSSATRFEGSIVIQRSDIPWSVANVRRMAGGNTPFVRNSLAEWEKINLHHVGRQEGKLIEVLRSQNVYTRTGGPLHIPGPGSPVRSRAFGISYWQQRLRAAVNSGAVDQSVLRQVDPVLLRRAGL